ncbi:MAG: NAD(+) synthase [Mycoplasmataceae bacterium]|nr:NAD(+) synthase [Mycoplasmataceae bacterium]
MNKYLQYLSKWISDYCKAAHVSGIIVGISGGIDSALLAQIAAQDKKLKVLGVWMNIGNSALDIQCVEDLKKQNKFDIIDIDLNTIYVQQTNLLRLTSPLALANLKARLRMTTLYALAQQNNLIVAGTGNADELYMGYFTKYGDGACDILPLANLTKDDIFTASKLLKLPSRIIERAPSASLFAGQTDENEMGVSYNDIDDYLCGKKISESSIKIIERFHKVNSHKFHLPIKPDKQFKKLK